MNYSIMKYMLVLSAFSLMSLSMGMPISEDLALTEDVLNDEQYQINGNYAQVRKTF